MQSQTDQKKLDIFEKNLYKNSQKSMLTRFFQKSKTLQFLEFSIINETTQTKLIPIRNKQCLEPKCIYDISDVLARFKKSKFNADYVFECKFCSNYVKLRDFCLDDTMNEIIVEYWSKFNEKTPDCIGTKIFRNGNHEPIFKAKPKKEEEDEEEEEVEEKEELAETKKNTNITKKKYKFLTRKEIDVKFDSIEIPKLEEFSMEEFEEQWENFMSYGTNDLFSIYGLNLTKKQINRLYIDEIAEKEVFSFFLKILEKNEIIKYKSIPKKRCFYAGFVLEKFERLKDSVDLKYSFLPGLEFDLLQEDFVTFYRAVVICMKFFDRWIGFVIYSEQGHNFVTIIDFLDPDLSMDNFTDFIDIIKEFLRKNGNFVKIVNFEFYKQKKINKYLDFSFYLLALCWKFSEKFSLVDNLKLIFPKEKDYVKSIIVWLILQIKSLNKKSKIMI